MKKLVSNISRIIRVIVLLGAALSFQMQAAEIHVSSIAALQSAINGASAGDIIILDNGTYLNNTLTIGTSNITVRAATPGGVYLNGTNNITISGNYVTFSGFQFTSGSITGMVITVNGSHNLVTQLNFDGYSAQKYILLNDGSQYNEISFCNFENKPTSAPAGNLIHVAAHASIVGYHKIRYCSFQNMPGAGGDNGNECIRLSNGAQSTYVARTVVEYCYFENTGMGDSEALSVKCRENVLRYNTFKNNQNAMMVFRNGDNNIGYGNFFINAGGIRVKEANNIYCYNNYFENSGVGGTMNAVTYIYVSPNLKNINFIHNTFFECGMIDLASGATNNTWANNIFKESSGNIFMGSPSGISWAGNIYTGTLGISIPSGMTNVDPQLVLNSDNYYALSSSSPAINAASASYPAILDIANIDDDPSLLLDISGQARPTTVTLKDVGCDEYTTGTIANHPLALSDVGPSYLGGPGGGSKQDQIITFAPLPAKVYGDADFNPGATASSGLTVSYTSSNATVATIVGGNIHIVGAGTSTITASQAGDANYNPAPDVQQPLSVAKANQTITFNALPPKVVGDPDFNPGATASSGLTVSYTSSNTAVATIVGGSIHIVGAGTSTITAAQAGNANYNAATDVLQPLAVTTPVTYTYAPTSTTITLGSLNSGSYSNLSANDASYYVVNSTTSGSRKTDWYGSVTISQAPAFVTKLTIQYDGKNSANKTQVLYLYDWSTSSWTQIDSRSVGTTDVTVTNTQTAPANFISSSGVIRLRVYSSGGNKNYTASGDWMQFVIETSGGGFAPRPAVSGVTGGKSILNAQPMESRRLSNYPNPFNPSTTLRYETTENAHVQVVVYDIRGAKVQELVNGMRSSGVYYVGFDASALSSGMYIVRLVATPLNGMKSIVNTHRITLMK